MSRSPAPDRLVAGRYRLGEVLGRGGMGVVWRATDELIGRAVAVKELRIAPGTPADERALFRQRALREARTAGQLNHPAVVAIHDVVPDNAEDEAIYIVSEFVDAPTLAELVHRDGALPPRRVTAIALRLLDVLATAHAAGVVHRDVKPGNVMVLPGDEVKLIDFGIARSTEDTRLTRHGVMGSTGYLAPELFHGDEPSPATDAWSLGVTLMYAINGQGPFDRSTTAATMHAILYEDLPTARCGPPLSTVISGLLTRDPGARLMLQPARELLTAAAPGDPDVSPGPVAGADPAGAGDTSGDAGRWGDDDAWERYPTTVHETLGHEQPAPWAGQGATDPATSYRLVLPRSVRWHNLVTGVVFLLLLVVAGRVLLRDMSMPWSNEFQMLVLAPIFWLLASFYPPERLRFDTTDDGLVLRPAAVPRDGPATPLVVGWDWVAQIAIAPATARARDRTKLLIGLTEVVPPAVIRTPLFNGSVHEDDDGGRVWTLGDVKGAPDEVAAAILAVAPSQVIVTPPTPAAARQTPGAGRALLWRKFGLVLVILISLAATGLSHSVLWDGDALAVLSESPASVVAYSPDGRLLTSADDATITLWDVAGRRAVAVLRDHVGTVTALDFHPEGNLLVSGDDKGAVTVWDVPGQRVTRRLAAAGGGRRIHSVRFSPDGAAIAALDGRGELALWRGTDHEPVPIDAADDRFEHIRFSADGRLLLGVGRDDDGEPTRRFWQTRTGRRTSPAGTFPPVAIVDSSDSAIRIWDAASGQTRTTVRTDVYVGVTTASGPGELLAVGGHDGVEVWQTATGSTVDTLGGNPIRNAPHCDGLAISPDARTLACGSDRGILLWTFATEGQR